MFNFKISVMLLCILSSLTNAGRRKEYKVEKQAAEIAALKTQLQDSKDALQKASDDYNAMVLDKMRTIAWLESELKEVWNNAEQMLQEYKVACQERAALEQRSSDERELCQRKEIRILYADLEKMTAQLTRTEESLSITGRENESLRARNEIQSRKISHAQKVFKVIAGDLNVADVMIGEDYAMSLLSNGEDIETPVEVVGPGTAAILARIQEQNPSCYEAEDVRGTSVYDRVWCGPYFIDVAAAKLGGGREAIVDAAEVARRMKEGEHSTIIDGVRGRAFPLGLVLMNQYSQKQWELCPDNFPESRDVNPFETRGVNIHGLNFDVNVAKATFSEYDCILY